MKADTHTSDGMAHGTSWASSPRVRHSMVSNRGKNTGPEVALRQRLHSAGTRFWIHRRPLAGVRCEADIVFPKVKLAVFVDGCFWHGCPQHASYPVLNGEWWLTKLEGNKRRDRQNDELLRNSGWAVLRLWEHQSVDEMTVQVLGVLNAMRASQPKAV